MTKLHGWQRTFALLVVCVAATIASPAQAAKTTQTNFKTLVNFDNNGANPLYVTLAQGFDGNLYGTTGAGIFNITPEGTLTNVAGLDGPLGCFPYAGVVQGIDGNFYGTAHNCGPGFCRTGCGTVFKATPKGVVTVLHSFCGEFCYSGTFDGEYPVAALVQATDGDFYGNAGGVIFKMTPEGTFTILAAASMFAGLVQATDGNFYGTTYDGGDYNLGTVLKMTPGGILTVLHSFNGSDGAGPKGGLVQAANGDLFGTTTGSIFDQFSNYGTVFEITPTGTLTVLHSFNGTDGAAPTAMLVQATDGNFYGTTSGGGASNLGTVFRMSPKGELRTLHSFDGTDGSTVEGGLAQATNGTFYGVTFDGGTYGYGTVFSLSVGLGPFVETLPTSGKAGAIVNIMGNNLQGSTRVTFHGKEAKFTVISGTQIVALVPRGAKTGWVRVKTAHSMLVSNVVFRMVP